MAHFRAVIKGQRGEASRLGSATSGIDAKINGWNSGVSVDCRCEDITGEDVDVFNIYVTGGSNNRVPYLYLGHVQNGVFCPSQTVRDIVEGKHNA